MVNYKTLLRVSESVIFLILITLSYHTCKKEFQEIVLVTTGMCIDLKDDLLARLTDRRLKKQRSKRRRQGKH
jgi:hypothetical protein